MAWVASLLLAFMVGRWLIAGGLLQSLVFERSRYGHTLELVKAYSRPGDGLLFYGPWQSVRSNSYHIGGLPSITALPPNAPPRLKPGQAKPVLRRLLKRYDRLWVLPAAVDDVDPDHFVAGWLNTHAHHVWKTTDFSLYVAELADTAPRQALDLTYGDALTLEEVAYEPQPGTGW